MKKNSFKLFLYELKKTFVLPLTFLTVCLAIYIFDYIVLLTGNQSFDMESDAGGLLTIFVLILLIAFTYRSFSTRKIYQKMRINPEKIFLVRLLYVFLYSCIFTIILIALGSIRLEIIKDRSPGEYYKLLKFGLFLFQGRSGWYFLFGVSIGATSSIVYSVVEFAKNIIFSNERRLLKIVWSICFLISLLIPLFVARDTYYLPSIGNEEFFSSVIPYGANFYSTYAYYFANAYIGDPMSILTPSAQVLEFLLCYNVTNFMMVLSGLMIIALSFTSIGFLNRRQNDCYAYESKKER